MLGVLRGLSILAGENRERSHFCVSSRSCMAYCFMVVLSLALGSFLSHMNISVLSPNLQETPLQMSGALSLGNSFLLSTLP